MENNSVLLVMSEDMQREFGQLISAEQAAWTGVLNCNEARVALAKHPDVSAVVCNDSLSDGNWYCVLKELVHKGLEANLLVVVPAGCDSGIIESHGIHGVLCYPPEPSAGMTIAQAANSLRQAVSG
jgi:DNA-binding NarL/FixJ family response regulator